MNVSSEVRRTLVKSPPELWAELSEAAALMRHLGEFGEIRITRMEAEKTVEWEAEQARGTVQLKSSGWGTKVTLSVTREVAEPERSIQSEPLGLAELEQPAEPGSSAGLLQATEPQPLTAPQPLAEPTLATEAQPLAAPQPAAEPILATEPQPATEAQPRLCPPDPTDTEEERSEPEPSAEGHRSRRGFFARLFRRRRESAGFQNSEMTHPDSRCEPDLSTEAEPTQPEVLEAYDPTRPQAERPQTEDERSPAEMDLAAELAAAEQVAAERVAAEQIATEHVTAVLTSVLDRLGAAHHRPFSRS
jgi:hypothetical protein